MKFLHFTNDGNILKKIIIACMCRVYRHRKKYEERMFLIKKKPRCGRVPCHIKKIIHGGA